jgi:hypothetical protein
VSYNGSGTFNINSAGQPVVSGTVISSTAFNALTADLGTGLTTALTKDGQSTPTANITLGGYKITNLAAGTAAADAVRFSQLQGGSTSTYITAAGTDTITGTVTPTLTAYATGQQFSFVVAATNTTAVTLNIDSVGAKAVTRTGSVALVAGDMVAGQVVLVEYDGTRFQLINGNNLKVAGTTSGIATIVTPAVAGTPTITLPIVTGTLATLAGTETLTNKTLTAPVIATITNTGTLTLPTSTGTLSLGLSSKMLAATRDMTLATGSVSYTGVGFKPTCLQAFGANTTMATPNAINGYCDSALGQAAMRAGTVTAGQYQYLASVLIYLGTDGAYQTFAVTSFDADGFTGTWTRTGAPGGTQNIAFLAFK